MEDARLALGLALGVNGLGGVLSNLRSTSSSVSGLPPLPLVPVISKESFAKQKDLYAAIGRALTSWAGVEDALCRVFCTAITSKYSHTAERAYWSIVSFEARLKMTDRVIQERLGHYPDKYAPWPDLKDRLVTQNTIRNKIAHGTVVLTAKTKKNPDGRWVLAPFYHARKGPELLEQLRKGRRKYTVDPNPKEKMSEREVFVHDMTFFLLRGDLDGFASNVEPRLKIEEALSRAGDQSHLGVLGGLIDPDPEGT